MGTAHAISPDQWLVVLQDIAQRNGTIELFVNPPEEAGHCYAETLQWKVRLLAVESGRLIVEQPTGLRHIPAYLLDVGRLFHGIACKDIHRWGFQTRLIGPGRYELHGTVTDSFHMQPPFNVHNAQRRDFYRVSTLNAGLDTVRLWPLLDLSTAAAAQASARHLFVDPALGEASLKLPQIGLALEGCLIDLSGGGALLQLDPDLIEYFNDFDLFWIRMKLPDHDAPLYMTARLARISDERENGRLTVGFAFVHDHDPPHRDFIEKYLCRFAAELQRQHLKHHH